MKRKIFAFSVPLLLIAAICVVAAMAMSAAAFDDVAEDAWYADGVQYISEQQIMNGVSKTQFDPEGKITRGMFVTILYRMEGSPAVSETSPFVDVAAGEYYEKPVIWAEKSGIVNGYSENEFAPNDILTREQFATMLYRYSKGKGNDVSKQNDLGVFADAEAISAYALEAMQWANAEGLIGGVSATELAPQGTATRAQAAVIMMRYLKAQENVAPAEETPVENRPEEKEPEPVQQESKEEKAENKPKPHKQPSGEPGMPTFAVSSAKAKRGDSGVKISVAVKNNPGIASIGAFVSFDDDLTLEKIEYGNVAVGESLLPANYNSPARLTWISPFADVSMDWSFATLYFAVSEDASIGKHAITLTYDEDNVYNLKEENIYFKVSNGAISVQ